MKKIALLLVLFLFPTMIFAATASPAAEPVKYDLPFPGMLPNNPLYFLKQSRDWILDKLIVDPIKKTEFYVLQGDKRLAMGLQLSATGNGVLSEQIISKGEKYMNSAVQTVLLYKTQGKEVPAYIVDRLAQSLAKHAEVVTAEILKATDATIKSGLTSSLDLVHTMQDALGK